MVTGAELAPTGNAVTVRVREGAAQRVDGPHASTDTPLGGVMLVDCESAEDALAFAERIPCATRGSVEVRAVAE